MEIVSGCSSNFKVGLIHDLSSELHEGRSFFSPTFFGWNYCSTASSCGVWQIGNCTLDPSLVVQNGDEIIFCVLQRPDAIVFSMRNPRTNLSQAMAITKQALSISFCVYSDDTQLRFREASADQAAAAVKMTQSMPAQVCTDFDEHHVWVARKFVTQKVRSSAIHWLFLKGDWKVGLGVFYRLHVMALFLMKMMFRCVYLGFQLNSSIAASVVASASSSSSTSSSSAVSSDAISLTELDNMIPQSLIGRRVSVKWNSSWYHALKFKNNFARISQSSARILG
jgi:hypothetical protein